MYCLIPDKKGTHTVGFFFSIFFEFYRIPAFHISAISFVKSCSPIVCQFMLQNSFDSVEIEVSDVMI